MMSPIGSRLAAALAGAADFAPSQLNFPVPKTNFTGAVVIEQPLINLDAWKGRSAALQQTLAAQAQLEDRRSSARLSVVQAFMINQLGGELDFIVDQNRGAAGPGGLAVRAVRFPGTAA